MHLGGVVGRRLRVPDRRQRWGGRVFNTTGFAFHHLRNKPKKIGLNPYIHHQGSDKYLSIFRVDFFPCNKVLMVDPAQGQPKNTHIYKYVYIYISSALSHNPCQCPYLHVSMYINI